MKMKKVFPAFAVVALVGGSTAALTGCSSWRNNFAYDIDFTADVKGTKIEFWTGFGSDINDEMGEILAEFTRLTGIKVKYESKGSYDNVLNASNLAATTGKFPNVLVGYPDHFASYVKQNTIVRLDYYFENDIHNPEFEPEGEKFAIDDFYSDYMLENQSVEFDENGNPYTLGVPFNKSTECLVYNKTFFSWCAAQDDLKDSIFVPATYQELDSVGKAILKLLKDKNVYNQVLLQDGSVKSAGNLTPAEEKQKVLDLTGVFEYGSAGHVAKECFKPFSYDSQANLFITTVRQNGGTYTYLDKNDKQGYVAFNSQETINGLNTIKTMYKDYTFGIPNDWDEAKYGSNPFKAQKTVMTLGSSAGVRNDAPPGNSFEIASAPVPYHSADKKFVISQGANLALMDKGSREQRLASWQLVKFLTKYANGYICAKTGYYPSSEYAEQGGMWANYDEEFIDYDSWLEEAVDSPSEAEKIKGQAALINRNYYVNPDEHWTKFVDQPFAGSAAVRNAVANIPGYLLTEDMTAQAAIDKCLSSLKDFIKS